MSDNWESESNPQNSNFDDLPFEYDQRLITRQPIDPLNDNIIEMLKVSLIKQSFDNWECGNNPLNANFDELTFDYYQRLITRRRIYCIHDNIVERLNNSSIIEV